MNKLAIILTSEKLDKIYPAVILASTSSAMGWSCDIFFTFWGLLTIKKDYEPSQISADYTDYKTKFMEGMKGGSMPHWKDMINQSRKIGVLKIHACSTTMELLGVKKEDFEDFVDDIIGAATFLTIAKDADITLYIS